MQAGGICMAACVHVCMCACLHVCMATCLHVRLALALKEARETRKAGRQVKSGREVRKGSKQACTSGRLGAMKAGCKYGRLVWKSQEREIYSAQDWSVFGHTVP